MAAGVAARGQPRDEGKTALAERVGEAAPPPFHPDGKLPICPSRAHRLEPHGSAQTEGAAWRFVGGGRRPSRREQPNRTTTPTTVLSLGPLPTRLRTSDPETGGTAERAAERGAGRGAGRVGGGGGGKAGGALADVGGDGCGGNGALARSAPPLAGEDAGAFDATAQKASSWAAFFAVLVVVLAALYYAWLDPRTGYGGAFLAALTSLSDNTEVVMLEVLLIFALVHSGGAALRGTAEKVIGERAYRVLFAGLSLPLAVSAVVYFINHRYSGTQLWQVRTVPGVHELVWVLSFVSFFFLYPSTFNLLEVAAVDKPKLHMWETGIMRITRHPQMVGQLIWCLAHVLWIGNSFMVTTSLGLCVHHAFGVWHGDRRLHTRYGKAFEEVQARTSIAPFQAIVEGRQQLPPDYHKEFLRAPYFAIVAVTLGAYFAHPLMQQASFWLHCQYFPELGHRCHMTFESLLDLLADGGLHCILLLLLGAVDGHHVRQRRDGALLALGVPVKHHLHLDAQHALHIIHDNTLLQIQDDNRGLPAYTGHVTSMGGHVPFMRLEDMSDASYLAQEYVPNSGVNIVIDRAARGNHVPILEFHALRALRTELAADNNLHFTKCFHRAQSQAQSCCKHHQDRRLSSALQ
eukprot:SM000141S00861  [mRNA]  locus=s141:165493:169273:+ [translate_table: standard]